MPLTNRDAQDSALTGALVFEEWAREWMMKWMMPELQTMQAQTDEQMVMMWDRLPMAMKKQYQQTDPQTYARAEQNINLIRERLKRATPSTNYGTPGA